MDVTTFIFIKRTFLNRLRKKDGDNSMQIEKNKISPFLQIFLTESFFSFLIHQNFIEYVDFIENVLLSTF